MLYENILTNPHFRSVIDAGSDDNSNHMYSVSWFATIFKLRELKKNNENLSYFGNTGELILNIDNINWLMRQSNEFEHASSKTHLNNNVVSISIFNLNNQLIAKFLIVGGYNGLFALVDGLSNKVIKKFGHFHSLLSSSNNLNTHNTCSKLEKYFFAQLLVNSTSLIELRDIEQNINSSIILCVSTLYNEKNSIFIPLIISEDINKNNTYNIINATTGECLASFSQAVYFKKSISSTSILHVYKNSSIVKNTFIIDISSCVYSKESVYKVITDKANNTPSNSYRFIKHFPKYFIPRSVFTAAASKSNQIQYTILKVFKMQ